MINNLQNQRQIKKTSYPPSIPVGTSISMIQSTNWLTRKILSERNTEIEKIVNKMQNEKIKGFKPSAKLSNLRLKVIGLMKMHRYEESELQSVELKELQRLQRSCWQKMALDVLQKKNLKEFAFLRSKNQDNLFKKMKERDTKLETLLKKHHIKRIQIQKYHRQKIRNIHSPQINARRSQ